MSEPDQGTYKRLGARMAICHPGRKHHSLDMCRPCYVAKNYEDNKEHRDERNRDAKMRRKYGITLAERDQMEINQGGGCALCFRDPQGVALHVDHDHATGRVRGLLCAQCNWYVAKIDKDMDLLVRLERYVRATH